MQGIFSIPGWRDGFRSEKRIMVSGCSFEIPYSSEQGINCAEQGIQLWRSGKPTGSGAMIAEGAEIEEALPEALDETALGLERRG